MTSSWKTSLCGILGGLCVGLSQLHELSPLLVKVFALLGATFPNIGLLFSRDNGVTSEQAGAKKSGIAPGVLPALLITSLSALAFFGGGCRNLEPGGVYTDKLTYEADKVITESYGTLHDFVKWEKDNRAALAPFPEIKKAADHIRTNAKQWIASAIVAREAYALAPGGGTRDDLTRALAVLRAALAESVKYLNQAKP